MTILEFAEVVGVHLEMLYPDTAGQWYVHLKGAETKEGGMLHSKSGRGRTPDEALKSYVEEIKGDRIVIKAYGDGRQEFNVPKTLTV